MPIYYILLMLPNCIRLDGDAKWFDLSSLKVFKELQ